MARTNSATEVYKSITAVDLYTIQTGTIGDTVIPGIVAKGAATVSVSGTTNFLANDPVFIIGTGGMELNEIAGTPATAMPLKFKAEINQDAGARFVEAVKVPLGYPTDAGVQFSGSLSNTAINSAISKLPIGYIPGVAELSLNFALLGFNIENLQLMFGADESVSGAGTTADPYQGSILGTSVGTAGLRALRLTGTRADGKTWTVDFLDFKHEISGNVQLSGATASYPIAGKCGGIIKRIWA